MTTHPSIDSSGALAITPSRENIFVRPRTAAALGPGSGGLTGPFDASAACAAGGIAPGGAASSYAARVDLFRRSTQVVALAGVVVLIAAVARPSGDGAMGPQGPAQGHRVSTPPVRHVAPPAVVHPAHRAPRRVRRSRRNVPSRRERRTRPRRSVPPAVVPVAPSSTRRPVPKQPIPTSPRPAPAPVPAGAPPEFM